MPEISFVQFLADMANPQLAFLPRALAAAVIAAVLCVVVSELVGVAAPFDAVHPVRARADVIPRVMAQLRAVLCVMAPAWTRAMLFAIVNNRV